MKIGKYEIKHAAGNGSTIYYIENFETGKAEKGAWEFMTMAILHAIEIGG